MEDHEDARRAEQEMEQELDELIQAAKKRPITDEEACVLFFHCGLPMKRENRL